MRRFLALAAVALPLFGCGPGDAGQGAPAPSLAIHARAVDITGGRPNGLRLRGAVVLTADHTAFGGFSGLLIRDGRMIAVSDMGWWLTADLVDGADGLRPGRASLLPMHDTDGSTFDKKGGDAEGLAMLGGQTAVSFERDHRIMLFDGVEPRGEIRARDFEDLASNSGMEALATLPDGRLIAIVEAAGAGGHPVFAIAADGTMTRSTLPVSGRHQVTGADVGPDGRLYVVLRDYVPLVGVSIRVHRYALGADGLPDPATREVLAAYESSGGIDNMEGIALWRDGAGRLRLTLISDDNFSSLQRTLVMDFEVTG